MRYEKVEALLLLAAQMQGAAIGVSLQDIQERFEVSRRTAERMRDAVLRVYGAQVDEYRDDDGFKRWRIVNRRNTSMPMNAEELAALAAAAKRCAYDGMDEQAAILRGVETKLKGQLASTVIARIEPDYEMLLEGEGIALRPGPRPHIDQRTISALRHSIAGGERIRIRYRSLFSGAESCQDVEPYGILYGHRHYLVAFSLNEQALDYRLFALGNILHIEQLGTYFQRDPSFSLNEYASRSFGIFQERPVNVVWRVSPEHAEEARNFIFHPTQTFEEGPDGSLLVHIRAGGLLEMCWHVFTWAGAIEILEPPELIDMMREQLESAARSVNCPK